jgi:phage terminase small subunit
MAGTATAERKLTNKQERFCQEYMIDLNATQAAIRAGYSKKTAAEMGHENLTKPHIAAKVHAMLEEARKRAAKTADDIRERLEHIGFTDLTDIIEFNEHGMTVLKNSKDIKPEHAAALESVQFTQTDSAINFKVKKINPLKALELLGKEQGMFVDKVEHGGSVQHIVEVVNYGDSKPKPAKG